jgi:phosphomannomutase
MLKRIENWSPEEINGQKVVERITKDGVKLVFADGSWVLIRASGTEPLFRIYTEAAEQDGVDKLQNEARKVLGL